MFRTSRLIARAYIWIPASFLTACAAKNATLDTAPAVSADQPAAHAAVSIKEGAAKPNRFWWPEQVDLSPLRDHHQTGPYGSDFDYRAALPRWTMQP